MPWIYSVCSGGLERLALEKIEGRFVLVTAHRRESFGPPLEESAPP